MNVTPSNDDEHFTPIFVKLLKLSRNSENVYDFTHQLRHGKAPKFESLRDYVTVAEKLTKDGRYVEVCVLDPVLNVDSKKNEKKPLNVDLKVNEKGHKYLTDPINRDAIERVFMEVGYLPDTCVDVKPTVAPKTN